MTAPPLEHHDRPPATTPYYSVCAENDPLAQAGLIARRSEYRKWRACQELAGPSEASVRDWSEHAADLACSIGGSERHIAKHLEALETLDRLPVLRGLVEGMMHLSMAHLCRIDATVLGVRPELFDSAGFWTTLDTELAGYLTPKKRNQLVPTPDAIARKIRALVALLEADLPGGGDAPGEEPEQPRDNGDYRQWPQADGTAVIEASHDAVTAAAIDKAVRAHAAANNISFAQAHAELILNNVTVQVTLNLYRATDLDGAPTFLSSLGVLSAEALANLEGRITAVRDMDQAGKKVEEAYRPGVGLRAFLEGRDWVCRWPGCNRPAERSQKDHCVDYEAGGPTTAANMASLCQHHHNRKTDGIVHYLLDPHTGDVYWLFEDRTWVVDEAEGPLAPRQRRWLRTLWQKRRGRQDARR